MFYMYIVLHETLLDNVLLLFHCEDEVSGDLTKLA